MTIDREELRRLCEAATPGPWFLRTNRHPTTDGRSWGWLDYQHGSASSPSGVSVTWEARTKSHDNARFIAAARTAMPALLDALKAAEAQLLDTTWQDHADHWQKRAVAAEARERKLREALELLVDHQNGCPLPKYEQEWTRAMELSRAVLAETAP